MSPVQVAKSDATAQGLLLTSCSPMNLHMIRVSLTCSVPLNYKRIEVEEKSEQLTVVRGVKVESERKNNLVRIEGRGNCGHEHCHPLCKWEHSHKIKHTGMNLA